MLISKINKIIDQVAAKELDSTEAAVHIFDAIKFDKLNHKLFKHNEPYLKDHTVRGDQVLMGVTFLSTFIDYLILHNVKDKCLEINDVLFKQLVKFHYKDEVKLSVDQNSDFLQITFERNKDNYATDCAEGFFSVRDSNQKVTTSDFDDVKFQAADNLYGAIKKADIIHGKSLQTLTKIAIKKGRVYGRLELDQVLQSGVQYHIHPAFFDGALVAATAVADTTELDDPFVPFSVKRMTVDLSIDISTVAYCICSLVKKNSEIIIFNVELYNDSYEQFAVLKEVVCKRIHKSKITDLSDSINKTSIQSTSKIEIANTELDDLDQMLFYVEGLLKRTNGSEKIFLDKNFIDQGLESMQLINLVGIIEKDLNIKLFPTILFEYPDPQSFAEYLITEFQSEFYKSVHYNGSHSIESDYKKENSSEGNQTIVKNNEELSKLEIRNDDSGRFAIIGMSGRFPGGNTIPEFWERIKNNESLISEIPADRWDWREYYNEGTHIAEHTVCKWGGYIDNATHFDNDFFSIGENEAKMMDPQLRQLLEVVHECAEDSGKILHLKGSNTGVFTGVCFHDYYDVMNRQQIQTNEYTGTGNAATILSNQISNFFDLKGPSLTIDTACSSSLIGLHVALQSIQSGDCDMAFVTGVNLLFSPEHYVYFSSKGFLSPTGITDSFGNNSDGYVPAEAVTSILIKPLAKAITDGDRIYAEICGTAVAHTGKTNNVTTPSTRQQAWVMEQAWQKARISPSNLAYIEGHGTGTNLGDAIELEAIKMCTQTLNSNCYLGSIKSNIGHSEGASGLVGIIKVVMAMKDKVLPSMPTYKKLNEIVDEATIAVKVNVENIPLFDRIADQNYAGVSSFGFGGSYAHVVLAPNEQSEKLPSSLIIDGNHLIPVSAKTRSSLILQLKNLKIYLLHNLDSDLTLQDISYTLFSCRETYEEKVMLVAESLHDLVDLIDGLLKEVSADNKNVIRLCVGEKQIEENLLNDANSWLSSNYLKRTSWTEKFKIKGKQVDLPFYSFDRKNFWFDEKTINHPMEFLSNHNNKKISTKADFLEKLDVSSLKKEVNNIISEITKIDEIFLEEDIELADFAIDSSQLYAITDEISERLGISINPTLFFQFRVYGELLAHLVTLQPKIIVTREENITVVKEQKAPIKQNHSSNDDDMAIIGMNGIFPGAHNLNEFWKILVEGRDVINKASRHRIEQLQTLSQAWNGGFIDGIDEFDYDFFKISKREACTMDPQQRLFLQSAWKTLEDAGINLMGTEACNIGVFAGVSTSDYLSLLIKAEIEADPSISTGNAHCSIANRVSYLLNLNGPSEIIDTACSSSLVAIHRAVLSIKNKDCDMALVGGVNLNLSDNLFHIFSKAGMLSPTGKCRPFSEDADGYIRGEGIGTILIKPYNKAIADKDQIYGIIKAVGVNHGGKANTYTSPNSSRQSELICNTMSRAGIDVNTIQLIEAHATATKLGDPVEVNGLKEAYKQKEIGTIENSTKCYLGSVKGNIGHLESAAGIAGLMKVLLAMKFKIIPPNSHAQNLNGLLQLEKSNFLVNTNVVNWNKKEDIPRRAAVSSFGFGGTNAHLIVEEYEELADEIKPLPKEGILFVLSAKSEKTLQAYCQDYLNFLSELINEGQIIDLKQLGYNLQCRRTHFSYRLVIIAHCIDDILLGLQSGMDSIVKDSIAIHKGVVKSMASLKTIPTFHELNYSELAQAWVLGQVHIDWKEFNAGETLPVMHLPSYPFARTTAWYTDLIPERQKNIYSPTANIEKITMPVTVDESALKGFLLTQTDRKGLLEGLDYEISSFIN